MSMNLSDPGKPTFRFLDLPAEVRNEVYSLYLPDHSRLWQTKNLPLLHTSSQLNTELSAVIYARSVFYVDLTLAGEYASFLEWIYNLSATDLSQIRHFRFKSTIRAPRLSGCPFDLSALFDIWCKPHSDVCVLGARFYEVCQWGGGCSNAHSGVGVSKSVTGALDDLVGKTRPERLTASDVVRWVRAILDCASRTDMMVNFANDCDATSKRFQDHRESTWPL